MADATKAFLARTFMVSGVVKGHEERAQKLLNGITRCNGRGRMGDTANPLHARSKMRGCSTRAVSCGGKKSVGDENCNGINTVRITPNKQENTRK